LIPYMFNSNTMKSVQYVIAVFAAYSTSVVLLADDSAKIVFDVPYGNESVQLLDVYQPLQNARRTAVVVMHGGGFIKGDKREERQVIAAKFFVSYGFPTVSVNYHLSDTKDEAWENLRVPLGDVATAIRTLLAGKIDGVSEVDRVVLVGFSAGGTLAAFLSLPACFETFGLPESKELKIAAAINFYGTTDRLYLAQKNGFTSGQHIQKWKDTSAVTWVSENSNPILTIHGTLDVHSYYRQAQRFDEKVNGAGGKHILKVLRKAPHGFQVGDSVWEEFDLEKVTVKFLEEHLIDEPPITGGTDK